MLSTPMLDAKQAAANVPTAEATLITFASHALESKAVSLVRASVALLVFSMLCMRPCPLSSWGAWLGIVAAIAVLCSSPKQLICRSRCARFLSFFTAIFAGVAVYHLVVSFRAGMPLQIADKVHDKCMEMPADTYTWAQHELVEHTRFHKGLSFLSRHMHNDTSIAAQNASSHLVGAADPSAWSQPEACNKIAHIAACFAKMMIVGSGLTHLFLFLAAVAVVKRACRLRCAAYRAGLLTWKCGAGCKSNKRAEPIATVTPLPPAAKEMA